MLTFASVSDWPRTSRWSAGANRSIDLDVRQFELVTAQAVGRVLDAGANPHVADHVEHGHVGNQLLGDEPVGLLERLCALFTRCLLSLLQQLVELWVLQLGLLTIRV